MGFIWLNLNVVASYKKLRSFVSMPCLKTNEILSDSERKLVIERLTEPRTILTEIPVKNRQNYSQFQFGLVIFQLIDIFAKMMEQF